jgi:hypothetical protein
MRTQSPVALLLFAIGAACVATPAINSRYEEEVGAACASWPAMAMTFRGGSSAAARMC